MGRTSAAAPLITPTTAALAAFTAKAAALLP